MNKKLNNRMEIVKGKYICFNPFNKENDSGQFNLLPVIEFSYNKQSFFETTKNEWCKEIQFRFEWLIWTSWITFYYNFYKTN